MRLTDSTDIALRVLIYAAAVGERRFTIDQVVEAYGTPRSTMMKVVNALTQGDFLIAKRGRLGGLRLADAAERITVGTVVEYMETDFAMVECMRAHNSCAITCKCLLIAPLNEASEAFRAVLNRYSIADIAIKPEDFGLKSIERQ